ncbi:hypothetical protein [Streptosporangium sp. NPDC002524]|uniref:hypothetical protein n=1 Tax=Streptosporangium sp. NPDC002524 TaxID=3154537 RepID=UPI003316C532
MSLTNAMGLRKASCALGTAMIVLGTYLLVSGCAVTLRADPAVLGEVRSIGKVLGESETESFWNGTTEVDNKFVVDVGGANAQEALNKASDLLRKRKWIAAPQKDPQIVQMHSPIWKGAYLSIKLFDPLHVGMYPEAAIKAIKEKSIDPEVLVIVNVGQSE